MKALDEYFLMVLFVLLLKRVQFLVNETQSVTTQMKSLDEYSLMALFVLLMKRVHFPKGVAIQMSALDGYTACVYTYISCQFLMIPENTREKIKTEGFWKKKRARFLYQKVR